jgi:hypothetical protein
VNSKLGEIYLDINPKPFKFLDMISKIKYAGLFMFSIGCLMKFTHTGIGIIQGNLLMIVGLLCVSTYALINFFKK